MLVLDMLDIKNTQNGEAVIPEASFIKIFDFARKLSYVGSSLTIILDSR